MMPGWPHVPRTYRMHLRLVRDSCYSGLRTHSLFALQLGRTALHGSHGRVDQWIDYIFGDMPVVAKGTIRLESLPFLWALLCFFLITKFDTSLEVPKGYNIAAAPHCPGLCRPAFATFARLAGLTGAWPRARIRSTKAHNEVNPKKTNPHNPAP